MKHYCDYAAGCEFYDEGYCWAHERPVDDIQEPCWADKIEAELRDT